MTRRGSTSTTTWVERVLSNYGLRTEREAVDFALGRLLVEPMTVSQVLAMQGSVWHGDLDQLRSGTGPRT